MKYSYQAEEVITEAIKQYPKGRFNLFNINCQKCEWGFYQARNYSDFRGI